MAQPQTLETTQFTISPSTRIGLVHYTVSNLDQQAAFYQNILGFKLHWRQDGSAGLGAGRNDLLVLTELAGARRVPGTTGLYHTAFLVPSRWDLAQLLQSIAENHTPIQGMTNHGTHFAIYLPDAEGNGIELAWDFPVEQWPTTIAEMMHRNRALPPEEVFMALKERSDPWQGLDPGTTIGHVHLHVSELGPTRQFYHDVLGFSFPLGFDQANHPFTRSAMFFAAGSYHHHIGTNVWQGVGAPPPPADATGLRYFTVVLPAKEALNAVLERLENAGIHSQQVPTGTLVHDPSQNGLLLTQPAV